MNGTEGTLSATEHIIKDQEVIEGLEDSDSEEEEYSNEEEDESDGNGDSESERSQSSEDQPQTLDLAALTATSQQRTRPKIEVIGSSTKGGAKESGSGNGAEEGSETPSGKGR